MAKPGKIAEYRIVEYLRELKRYAANSTMRTMCDKALVEAKELLKQGVLMERAAALGPPGEFERVIANAEKRRAEHLLSIAAGVAEHLSAAAKAVEETDDAALRPGEPKTSDAPDADPDPTDPTETDGTPS